MRALRLLPTTVVVALALGVAVPAHAATPPQLVSPASPLLPAVVGDVVRSAPAIFGGDPAPEVTQQWQRCSRLIDHVRVEEPAHLWRLAEAPATTVATDVVGGSTATYGAATHVSVPGAAVGEPDRAVELDGGGGGRAGGRRPQLRGHRGVHHRRVGAAGRSRRALPLHRRA